MRPRSTFFKTLGICFSLLLLMFSTAAYSPVSGPNVLTLTPENMVVLKGAVTAESITRLQQDIFELTENLSEGSTIYLVLDTPGGSVYAGRQLLDTLEGMPQYHFKTVTLFAASMGFTIAQSLEDRLLVPSGVMMAHRASINGLSGEIPGSAETFLKFIKRMVEQVEEKVAARMRMTLPEYHSWIRDEYWVIGKDAVADEAADQVQLVACSSELYHTRRQQKVRTIFGSYKVTYSGCPLSRSPLEVNTKNLNFPTALAKERFNEFLRLYHHDSRAFVSSYITNGKYRTILR